MNKGARGTGLYIMLGLLLILLIFALRDSFNGRSDITTKELESMLEDGSVSMVEVVQNEEVPTGSLKITTTQNDQLSLNVTDVNQAVAMVSAYDVTVRVQDVSRRSTLFSTFLPVLLTGLMVLFLFMMMNRQQKAAVRNIEVVRCFFRDYRFVRSRYIPAGLHQFCQCSLSFHHRSLCQKRRLFPLCPDHQARIHIF